MVTQFLPYLLYLVLSEDSGLAADPNANPLLVIQEFSRESPIASLGF